MSVRVTRRAALAGLAGATMLSSGGCSRERPPNVLRVAYAPTTLTPLYRKLAAAFEAQHPAHRVELLPASTYRGVLQRDFRLALVEDEPDVSHVGLNHLRFYVERDLALPLDPLLAAEPAPLTAHRSIGHFGGKTRALPFAVSVPVSYFNNTLCQRAGLDPRQLALLDWPQILDLAGRICALRGDVTGIFFDYDSESALAWQMLVLSRGGRMMSEDERYIAFGDEAGLWSANIVAGLGRAGQVDMSRENARMAFSAGLLGCYQNTSANIQRFSANVNGFGMTVVPLPVSPTNGRLPAAGNAVVIPTRNTARHEVAWKYVRFVTGPIGQRIMMNATGYLSLNPVVAAEQRSPLQRPLYEKLAVLDAWYAFPGPRSDQVGDLITDALRRVLLGREKPETALAALVRDAQQLIDRGQRPAKV